MSGWYPLGYILELGVNVAANLNVTDHVERLLRISCPDADLASRSDEEPGRIAHQVVDAESTCSATIAAARRRHQIIRSFGTLEAEAWAHSPACSFQAKDVIGGSRTTHRVN